MNALAALFTIAAITATGGTPADDPRTDNPTAIIATDENPATDYRTAYYRAQEDDKPLLVLVTAEWCPPCRAMKTSTVPQLVAKGTLEQVHFAVVDYDRQNRLARRLIGNRPLPQLILFHRQNDQWEERSLTGYQSVAAVEALVDEGITKVRTAAANSETGR